MPIYFNDTYYLYDPDRGITVGPVIDQDPGLVKVETGKLQEALDELAKKAETLGKARNLEIHCHGGSGQVYLGSRTGVNLRNVAWFGTQLRKALVPNALIEILACKVGSQRTTSGSFFTSSPLEIDNYCATYHGKLQELFKDRNWTRGYASLIYTGATSTQKTIHPFRPGNRMTFDPDQDGLEFCRQLATAANATVRAAISSQAEDGAVQNTVLTPSVSPIGNWEGPVFDFFPDRSVRFVGMAPFRQSSWGPMRIDTDMPLGNA